VSEKRAKKVEQEKRAAGLLDEMERLEERRGTRRHPNRKNAPADEDIDLGAIP
jgi:hypothetical protein